MAPKKFEVDSLSPGNNDDGTVYLHDNDMKSLNLDIGDAVKVSAGGSRGLIVGNPRYEGNTQEGKINMGNKTRRSLRCDVGDEVIVEKIDAPVANSVKITVKSGNMIINGLGNFLGVMESSIKSILENKVISRNTRITIDDLGELIPNAGQGMNLPMKIEFQVDNYRPDAEYVKVNDNTDLVLEAGDSQGLGGMGRGRENPRDRQPPQSGEGIEIEEESPDSLEVPDINYEDIGGLESEIEKAREMVELPMKHPEIFETVGIEPPKGLLLHGPPGTGKTLLAKAIANQIEASFHTISGPEIMSKYYGQSEQELRDIFERAEENAPAIVFIDELDAIAPKRESVQGEVESRVVSQLLSLMDGLEARGDVVVIAATNRVDSIDNALRRGGRFDREIEIGVPDKKGRKEILQIHTRGMQISDEFDPEEFAEKTHGFVGADIEVLCKEAAMNAIRRVKPELNLEADEISTEVLSDLTVEVNDFEDALMDIEPSAMREVFIETPEVDYDDIGGLDEVKNELIEVIEWPMLHDNLFDHLDVEESSGILLHGPPGTGKTLLAKAVSNASNANFISVKGPELLNKYVGESEKGIREVFKKARQNSPSIIFFDEIDSITPERGQGGGDTQVTERVVSQLLTELDGIEGLEGVKVIAASNRPDLIDKALLRPGRLDRILEVPVPDSEARKEIFRIHTSDKPINEDVDLDELADRTENYTGSDIAAICREASMQAMRKGVQDREEPLPDEDVERVDIKMEDFNHALEKVKRSMTDEDLDKYKNMSERVRREEIEESGDSKGRGFQ
jgi:transitional endoplasmic reticulum ATPase